MSGVLVDRFPGNGAAVVDEDLDGFPDQWHENCEVDCQINSGLTLDPYPNEFDNDGIPWEIDPDDNNDGIIDVDADSDGLIDINSLVRLNAIRYNMEGTSLVMYVNAPSDAMGCPFEINTITNVADMN